MTLLKYLFVDMNSYFASVEQQDQPQLRDKPVGVVPIMTDSTCCIAASYEAKDYGVKTGTNVGQAKSLCPGIQLIEARPMRYVQVHHQIIEAVESCLHVDHICSIDEMYGRLMGQECQPDRAIELARRVKAAIYDRVGEVIRCSIGLGPNAWLAKVATDMQKPDGLVTILPDDLPRKLYSLQLTDLPGIGPRMGRRLRRAGVPSVAMLCSLSPQDLAKIWQSKWLGEIWWNRLHGQDLRTTPTKRRSVGHSHVLAPKYRNAVGVQAVLSRLIHKAAARLRRLGYRAEHLTLSVRFVEGPRWARRVALGQARDTLTMMQAVAPLWSSLPKRRKPLKVSVVLTELVAEPCAAIPLFGPQRRRDALADAMDRLDRKHGRHTVYFASMCNALDSAPARIAFTQIPGLDE